MSEESKRNIKVYWEKLIELNKDVQDLENQIDEMVYDLYELTEEEKELVRNFK